MCVKVGEIYRTDEKSNVASTCRGLKIVDVRDLVNEIELEIELLGIIDKSYTDRTYTITFDDEFYTHFKKVEYEEQLMIKDV